VVSVCRDSLYCPTTVAGARLLRLQCHEGIDEAKASTSGTKKQLLRIQCGNEQSWDETEANIFTQDLAWSCSAWPSWARPQSTAPCRC
jgi:hypothetical protein